MEFACGFFYVSPVTKTAVKAHQIKRSALLPPNRSRPKNPPPPPPAPPKSPLTYDLPTPDLSQTHSECSIPECTRPDTRQRFFPGNARAQKPATAPPLPPRPPFMKRCPEYLLILPSSSPGASSSSSSSTALSCPSPSTSNPSPHPRVEPSCSPSPTSPAESPGYNERQPLPGNPNVVLVALGKLLNEYNGICIQGEPSGCSQCGSALESCYDNVVKECYFCQSQEPGSQPSCPPIGCEDSLFCLTPDLRPKPTEEMIIFCIDISGSTAIQAKVMEEGQLVYRSRLQLVQKALLKCIDTLSEQDPNVRVGLITFNSQVTLHGPEGGAWQSFRGDELTDEGLLRVAGRSFLTPPLLSQTRDSLESDIKTLQGSGGKALGPAALVAIAVASQHPGSKVLVFTDGKPNSGLGNLEDGESDPRSLVSSSIFYQELGESAASQGVTVSVLTVQGTDCRLDELGRLADRTGGKVVKCSPVDLFSELMRIIENRTIATHCSVTLLLPTTMCVKGEREGGHRGIRIIGNIASDSEITFQYGAKEQNKDRSVSIQLQVRFRRRDGLSVLRVVTMDHPITDDSSVVLSSIALSILQLSVCQTSAALAVRGRVRDAQTETEQQRQLIHIALDHCGNAEEKWTCREWLQNMEVLYNNLHQFTRRTCSVSSDAQSLTDEGAVLLYGMKNSNRTGISLTSACNL